MPETRARDLANLAGAGATSSTVAYHETARAFTLPAGAGDENQVISSDGDGTTTWKTTLTAPVITDVTSTKGINRYESATDNGGGTFTVTGTDFGSTTGELTATISSDSSGVTNTVGDISCSSVSGTGGTTAVFTITGAESGFSNWTSSLSSSSIYVKVTKQGLPSNIVALSGGVNTLSGDPTITVSGTASTTTVSTTDLGSYGGQVAGGGTDSNTKLLLNFDRNGGTDFEDSSNTGSDGHKVTASGGAAIKATPFGDGKSAIYFDGSSDKLTIATPSGSGLHSTLGSNNNWFWEAWIYYLDIGSNANRVIFSSRSAAGVTALYIYVNEVNDRLGLLCGGSSSWYVDAYVSGSMDTDFLNKWGHLLVQRNGNTLEAYINGIKRTITGTNDFSSNTSALSVGTSMILGADIPNANDDFKGYLDEVRIGSGNPTSVSSDPLYISSGTSFSVPTSRYTAVTSDKLLIHSNQEDDSSDNKTSITAVAGAIPKSETTNRGSGAHTNFGSSAWYFDGTDDYLSFPISADFASEAFGADSGTSKDFTIEGWYRFDTVSADQGIWGIDGTNELSIYYENGTDKLTFREKTGDDSTNLISGSWDPSANTWYHIALVRASTTTRLYVDGTELGNTLADLPAFSAGEIFEIGTDAYGTGRELEGYVDSFRISKFAVYVGTFTPQATALTTTWSAGTNIVANTDSSNVIVLIQGDGAKFDDSSDSDHDITPTGAYHSQGHGGIAPAMTWPANRKANPSSGVYFNGTTDYLTIPSSDDFHFDTAGVFSIDFWAYWNDLTGTQNLMSRSNNVSSASQAWTIQSDGKTLRVYVNSAASDGVVVKDPNSNVINVNTWHHIQVYRTGGYTYLRIDGSAIDNAADANDWEDGGVDADNILILGARQNSGAFIDKFHGYIDSVRIQTGTVSSITSKPTQIYGAFRSQDVGTITITGVAGDGDGDVAFADDYSASSKTQLSTKGLILTDTGAGNNTATITGTLDGVTGTQNSIFAVKATANADAERTTIVGGTNFLGITQNTPVEPVLFNARRYMGNATVREINGFGLTPDLVWIKNRDVDHWHNLYDSVRGAGNVIYPNETNVQDSASTGLTSFNSDGFSVGSEQGVNQVDKAIIAWAWKAGGAPSAGKQRVDNSSSENPLSSGTHYSNITNMKQSVNSTGKFSITQYTGGSATSWFKHGLGATTPDMFIIKSLGSTDNWIVWHKDLSTNDDKWLYLDTNDDEETGTVMWADTPPDNDGKIHLGNTSQVNTSNSYICYAWKAVSGVSAFGTYEGNSTSGSVTAQTITFPNIGGVANQFAPSFVMIKSIDSTDSWWMYDNARVASGSRNDANQLRADTNHNEANNSTSTLGVTLKTDNGFTVHDYGSGVNNNGTNYIYMAFA